MSLMLNIFEGSDMFYLADPSKVTVKQNGGSRWGVGKEFYRDLAECIEGHVDGSLKKGVVLPPIRKKDNRCKFGAIDIDGSIYQNNNFKINILNKIKELNLPLFACLSKSKGLHLYIFFANWTDAQVVIDILHTFLFKLELPIDTECFPKQAKVKDTANGIMLPFMHGVGNDWIKSYDGVNFITGSIEEFSEFIKSKKVNASDIKIELPEKPKPNGQSTENDWFYNLNKGPTKLEILQKIKDGTIEQHPTMGGKYHSWIQVVIAKAVVGGYGDNEILQLIKEVHEDNRGLGYKWPESYIKQINYTRQENRLNKPNPGETKFLEGITFNNAVKLEKITKTYCYVMANDMFNKLGTGDFFQGLQINNYHKHETFIKKGSLTDKLLSNPKFSKAETFITNPKYPPGLMVVDRPGIVPLIKQGTVLNIYIPNYLNEKKGDVKFIVDLYVWLLGAEKWKVIEQWIAYMLQYPGEKIKWALVIVSPVEGTGKALLARICSRILGSENVNENADYKHLTNTHNTLLIGRQLVVINELSLGDFKGKSEGTNSLKNFVGDDTYTCNFKNKPMVILPNCTNFILYSQDPRVLTLAQGVRRYFFCHIKKTEEEIIKISDQKVFKKAYNFADSEEGGAALLYYFKKEVKILDPDLFKQRAPQTDDLKELIEESKHPLQKKLEHDLTRADGERRRIFNASWSGLITFHELNDKLSEKLIDYDWGSFGDDAIYKFLDANAIRWNNGEATKQITIKDVKQRFYILDDTRCPVPGKSYKDLTPKQIEAILKNYLFAKEEIIGEQKRYDEAVVNQSKLKEILNILGPKQKTIDQIKEAELIISRGIRSVDRILEDISSGVSKPRIFKGIC